MASISVNTMRPFTASQKGQVSVDLHESVVLISDSHWYWWYVRANGSEGFVPAEILELPNETLARLNCERNTEITSVANAPALEAAALRSKLKRSIRFNDARLVSYEGDSDMDISDDTESDSSDTLSPVRESVIASTTLSPKVVDQRLQILTGDEIELTDEFTVPPL